MESGIDAVDRTGKAAAKGSEPQTAGLSLLFRPGRRPSVEQVSAIVEQAQEAGLKARVSHRSDSDEGWVELLASGLTFDFAGLAPTPARGEVEVGESFGFEEAVDLAGLEAVHIVPSEHIAAGTGLQPVLRTMMGLAANLVLHLPVAAIHWGPAQTVMEPRYFSRAILNWLAGGAFPALGLTSIVRGEDGTIVTRGLAYMTGQEMQMEGRKGEAPADTVKIAARVIDHLARRGHITEPTRIGTEPDALVIEPSQVGKLVLVWRGG